MLHSSTQASREQSNSMSKPTTSKQPPMCSQCRLASCSRWVILLWICCLILRKWAYWLIEANIAWNYYWLMMEWLPSWKQSRLREQLETWARVSLMGAPGQGLEQKRRQKWVKMQYSGGLISTHCRMSNFLHAYTEYSGLSLPSWIMLGVSSHTLSMYFCTILLGSYPAASSLTLSGLSMTSTPKPLDPSAGFTTHNFLPSLLYFQQACLNFYPQALMSQVSGTKLSTSMRLDLRFRTSCSNYSLLTSLLPLMWLQYFCLPYLLAACRMLYYFDSYLYDHFRVYLQLMILSGFQPSRSSILPMRLSFSLRTQACSFLTLAFVYFYPYLAASGSCFSYQS